MNQLPKIKTKEIVVQQLETELLIYDLQTNKAFCLNSTSALVYQLCDGTKSAAEISRLISEQLRMSVPEEFVWLALDGLKKDGLLEKSVEFAINFNGLTRRQVIKKIGFASMIALPMVSSVVAPSAANAASGGSSCASSCIRGGQVCANCVGPAFITEFNSTDGSCSGGISISYNTSCFGPNPFGLSTIKDFIRS